MAMSELRTPKYLSPSSLAKFEREPDQFFYRYICPKELRPEREPQTDPMSVGSAFDALVKAELYQQYFGVDKAAEDGYTRRNLVQQQCEEHTLPLSLEIACDCFDQYVQTGAYQELFDLMNSSPVAPRMEFDLTATIGGVPLLGKPDLHFHTVGGCHIITDWKVSGSCSRLGVSPQQGFQITRATHGGRGDGLPHGKYVGRPHCGVNVNTVPMNETTDYWADQLTTYAWALGEEIGSQSFIARIEQLACRPCPAKDSSGRLRIKCVTHQATVDRAYQENLLERYQKCWHAVTTGHYFQDITKSESDGHVNHLLRDAKGPVLLPPSLAGNDVQAIDFGGNHV